MPTSVTKKEKVLIIEGNTALGERMANALRADGFIVFLIKDGAEGLKAIYDSMPQLIIIDLVLPNVDGYDILAKKASDTMLSKIPVYILSTQGEPINMRRVPENSVTQFIVSLDPDPSDLISRINTYFGHGTTAPSKGANQAEATPTKGKKILWVEDDKLIGSILAKKFISSGFDLTHMANGEGAFAYLKDNIPDIIILDLMLPGMDGFEILQKIRMDERLKKVPAMILSNLSKPGDFEKAKMLGANKFMVKAASSLDQIIEEVRKLAV
jgi:DNA-binding response OmpR family regulator